MSLKNNKVDRFFVFEVLKLEHAYLAEVAGEVPNAGLMGPLAPLRRAAKEGESTAQ